MEVSPRFVPEQSTPERFLFAYQVRVTNQSDQAVQLLSRRWVIIDAEGTRREVEGEGVVGRQPVLEPGEAFEYASFCPLETGWGTMEGEYRFQGEHGSLVARIGRFYLVSGAESAPDPGADRR